jgi:hypothetical protein
MKRVYYASGSVLTGDRTADAIVHYAEELASKESSDTIDIPVALGDGEIGRAQLLIGPASQLVVVPEPGEDAGPDDEATLEELSRRRRSMSSPHPQASDEASITYYAEGTDYTAAFDGEM